MISFHPMEVTISMEVTEDNIRILADTIMNPIISTREVKGGIHLHMDILRNRTMDIMDIIHLTVLITLPPILLHMDILMEDILNMLHHHRINPIHTLRTDLPLDPVNHLLPPTHLEYMAVAVVAIGAHHCHIK